MPDYTVKADVDTMLRANDKAGIRSAIGVGQTDAPTFLAQSLTGQSLTGTQATSLVDLATTWLSTTGTPTAIKLNVTDTANVPAASKLLDLQVGGNSLVSVEKSGLIVARASSTSVASNPSTAPNGITFAGSNGRTYISSPLSSGNGLIFWQDNGAGTVMAVSSQAIKIQESAAIQWCGLDSNFTPNTILVRDGAAGILAQRNGTAKQVHRVYNTFLGTTANEWGGFDWLTTTNTLRIGTEHGGTGAARPIDFVTGGVVRMSIAAGGEVTFQNALVFGGNGQFRFLSNGVAFLTNAAQTDFNRLCLGGNTSAFPAIKRNGTGIDIRLADDSAFAPIKGKLTTDTNYAAGVPSATGYITIYDATGTAYRVPCTV